MNKIPPSHPSIPEPDSLTSEKEPIRKAQEEYLDDQAGPSMDKSEYERWAGKAPRNPRARGKASVRRHS